jgi:actin-related protein
MGKHIFICHSTHDKLIAEEVCKALESRDIRCWMAPRDIPPGAEWAETIVDAVDNSSGVVLVLSSNSNSSPQVIREIGRAVSKNVTIIPFRIDDTPLSPSMEYFLSTHQWLDALKPPLERHFQKLADTVQRLLDREAAKEKARQEAETARARREAEEARKAQEAARAKKEAEEAAKEKARRKAEAARAKGEVVESRKAREAAKAREEAKKRAKKEAELAAKEREKREAKEAKERAKEKARQEAEVAQARREAARAKREAEEARKAARVEAPAGAGKRITRSIWLWAVAALLLVGLVIAGLFAIPLLTTEPSLPTPTLTSPGTDSEPGPVLDTMIPVLQWDSVPDADYYFLTISKYPYGQENIIYYKQVTGTSHFVLSATLAGGERYCWNVQAHGAGGLSGVSNTLYFQTPSAPSLLIPVSGYVRESGTNAPISGAKLTVWDHSSLKSSMWVSCGQTTTNSEGYYEILSLSPGTYAVRVEAEGYTTEWFSNTYTKDQAAPILVTGSSVKPDVNFSLESGGGSISGKVIADASLGSIANLHVNTVDYNSGEWIAGVNTRADGTYTLSGLPAGTYKVRAEPSVNKQPYVGEYYDNNYDFWGAQPVTVTTGQETTGINFSLAPGGSVSGTVRNADGSAPLANVDVECYRIVNGRWESWCASTDSQGNYTIYGVPYGDFGVRAPSGGRGGAGSDDFVQEYYNEKSREAQASRVTIASGVNPTNVNFTMEVGDTISGRVISDVNFSSIAYLWVNAWDYTSGEWMSGTFTRSDGTYTLHGLPAGTYRVGAWASQNKLPYVDEYYDNTTNRSAAQPVAVSVGEDTPDINFSLASTAK